MDKNATEFVTVEIPAVQVIVRLARSLRKKAREKMASSLTIYQVQEL